MLDRHHQLTGSFLHDHYSVIAVNPIFLTILDGNGTRDMWVFNAIFSNNSRNRRIYHWINAIFLTILDGNGTQGMRVADSLQWHAWYADAWLTATARKACVECGCSRVQSSMRACWLLGMECYTLCKQHDVDWQLVCTSPSSLWGPGWAGPSVSDRRGFGPGGRGFRRRPCPIGV